MNGYYHLSSLIGAYPDFAIFRTFRSANVLNLLVLQSEIDGLMQVLGKDARQRQEADAQADRSPLEHSFHDLKKAWMDGDSHQYGLILQLRSLLPVYNQAFLQYQNIARFPPARSRNLRTLQDYLKHKDWGFLRGREAELWDNASDLTSLLETGENDDTISRWLNETFLTWYHRVIGHKFKKHELPVYEPAFSKDTVKVPFDHYPDSTVTAIVTGISTILSSLLPCLSIFVLYYVRPPVVRLSIILGLSMLFSIAMTLIAKSKRGECFGATAAFAAVLVVFVGSTDSNNCSCAVN